MMIDWWRALARVENLVLKNFTNGGEEARIISNEILAYRLCMELGL